MPDPSPTDIPANLRRRPELWMVLLFLVSLAALGFFLLAGEVVEGDTAAFDEAILLALRTPGDLSDPIGSHWVEEMARAMTALGGVAWLTSLTIGVAGYLALSRHTRTMWFLLIAIGSGTLISRSAKMLFERARPDLVPHGSYVYTASFPSGHTMLSAVTYLTLAVMLYHDLRDPVDRSGRREPGLSRGALAHRRDRGLDRGGRLGGAVPARRAMDAAPRPD